MCLHFEQRTRVNSSSSGIDSAGAAASPVYIKILVAVTLVDIGLDFTLDICNLLEDCEV
jgi:hypothetical protein